MLKRQPKLVVFLMIQVLISSCIPSSVVKTSKANYSNRLQKKQALSLSDYIRTVYKVSQQNTEEAEQLRRKFLDSNPGMAQVAARVEANPSDMEARKILAAAYLQQGLLPAAYLLYQEVRSAAGERGEFEAELGLARIWDKWADYSLALQHANAASVINPGSAEAYATLGKIHLHRRALDEAAGAFKLALQIAPETPATLANLGYAYMLAGKLQEARTAIENALALDGTLAEARNNLGIILAKMGDISGALAQMQQVGGTPVALNNLGALLLVEKKPVEAMRAFQEALQLDPGYTRAEENLSIARGFVPPPAIVNLPPFEASSVHNKQAEDVSFSKKINKPEVPGPSIEGARRLADGLPMDPGVFQGRIDADDLKALARLSRAEAFEAPLPPLQPPAEVPAFVAKLLEAPAFFYADSGAVRSLPLPLLKNLEPVLTPPIEPATEIPRFALELQKTKHLQDLGSRSVRALPLLRTVEPVMLEPIEPPTEAPRFALELQKIGHVQNLGAAQVRAPRPGVPGASEPVLMAPVPPPTQIPRFALELQKTARLENLGVIPEHRLPQGLPEEPVSAKPYPPAMKDSDSQESTVSADFVSAAATAKVVEHIDKRDPQRSIEKGASMRTMRVADHKKSDRPNSARFTANTKTQSPASEASAKVAVESGRGKTSMESLRVRPRISASRILIFLALTMLGACLLTLASSRCRNSRSAQSSTRRSVAPQMQGDKPIRAARAG